MISAKFLKTGIEHTFDHQEYRRRPLGDQGYRLRLRLHRGRLRPPHPPGGQGRITLTIAPYSVLRQFTKKTKVSFNDPDQP